MRIKQSDGRFHHAGAICHFPFVCTLASRQSPCCLKCDTNPFRACPCATKFISGEPNTPLFFRRWDACHSKQQAGYGKSLSGLGRARKVLSLVYPTMLRLCARSFNRKISYDFNHVVVIWGNSYGRRTNTSSGTRINQQYLSVVSPIKTPDPFGRISDSPILWLLDILLILSPLFLSRFIMSIAKLTIRIKLRMSNGIPHLHLQRLAHVMANFYHRLWQVRFRRLNNLCHNQLWKSGKH